MRLLARPWLRAGFIAVIAAFCAYGLVAEWPQTHAALAEMNWFTVASAGLAALAGSGCMLFAWRTLLADLGSQLTVRAATRVISVSQLGKYLPGAVWAFAAQLELAKDYEVPRRRCATTVVTSLTESSPRASKTRCRKAVPISSPVFSSIHRRTKK